MSDGPRWVLVMHRQRKPWWGFGLITRRFEIEASQAESEEAIRARCAEMQAKFPQWEYELREMS